MRERAEPHDELVIATKTLQALFVLMRTVMAHGGAHPLTLDAAERVAKVFAGESPWTLQWVRGGVFRDQVLLELSDELYWRAAALSGALEHLGVNELRFAPTPSVEAWLALGEVLAVGALGPYDGLERLRLEHISWRAIPNASWGEDAEEIDPEVFALIQLALSLRDVEALHAGSLHPWPWGAGLRLLRRLERAAETHRRAGTRALELAPEGWTVARRACSAAYQIVCVLQDARADAFLQRTCAHTVLALALHGYTERGGAPLPEAAARCTPLLEGLADTARSGAPNHHMRVAVNLHLLASAPPTSWPGPLHLCAMLYELERQRCPERVTFALTLTDLLASVAQDMGTLHPPLWAKALIQAHDTYPPGAHVRLPDGRLGMVLDTTPKHIDLLIDGQLHHTATTTRLQLVSSLEVFLG